MIRFIALAATLVIGVALPASARDVALVIGNSAYNAAPPNATAVSDARAVRQALEGTGYELAYGTDVNRSQMRQIVDSVAPLMRGADRVLIVYFGHSVRLGTESYLMPVDAAGSSPADAIFDGIPLSAILSLAAEASGRAVVFLDAAQLRGFESNRQVEPGLAQIEAPDGVLVVTSAEPGRALRRRGLNDSRFARLLVDRFLDPEVPVMQTVNNVGGPIWTTGAVSRELTLLPDRPFGGGQGDDVVSELELALWTLAERSGLEEDYRAYLDRFPDGRFANEARARLDSYTNAPPGTGTPNYGPPPGGPEAVEEALGLGRGERREVQAALKLVGFDPRGVDGIFGPATRNAIRSWQATEGLRTTGYLDGPQLRRLSASADEARARAEAEARAEAARDDAFWARQERIGTLPAYRRYAERYPSGRHIDEARDRIERIVSAARDEASRREVRLWRRVRQADRPEGYRDYLSRYPDGAFSNRARARLNAIEGGERDQREAKRLARREAGLGLGPRDRLVVERRLSFAGFDPGKIDGRFGPRARRAIAGFQDSRRLEPTGYLNRPTLVAIARLRPQRERQVEGADVMLEIFRFLEQNAR